MKVFDAVKKGLLQAGAKMAPDAGKFIKKVAPAVTASMVLKQIQEIPLIDKVFDGLSRLWDIYNDKLLNKIPVFGWINEKIGDYVAKPIAQALGGYRKSENGEEWYTSTGAKMPPANIDRSMRFGDNIDIYNPYLGDVPSLSIVNVDCPSFLYSGLDLLVDNLDENITFGLQRNQTYTPAELKTFIVNSIGYYIIGKQLERKIGFLKYHNFDNNYFRDIWTAGYSPASINGDGPFPTTPDKRFDISDLDNGFVFTQEMWDEICKLDYTLMLPKNIKAWIDHYCGSVFVADKDVKNNKYFYFRFNNVQLLELSADKKSFTETRQNLDNLDYYAFYNTLKAWFSATKNLRADLSKAVIVVRSKEVINYLVTGFEYAWFENYDAYQPTFVDSDTARQALLNCYTDNVAKYFREIEGSRASNIKYNGYIRLDYIDDNYAGDPFTSILFLGNIVPKGHPLYNVSGFHTTSVDIIVYGSEKHPIRYPSSWNQFISAQSQVAPAAYVERTSTMGFRISSNAVDNIKVEFSALRSSPDTYRVRKNRLEFGPDDNAPEGFDYDNDVDYRAYPLVAANFQTQVMLNMNSDAIVGFNIFVPLFIITGGSCEGHVAYAAYSYDKTNNKLYYQSNMLWFSKKRANETVFTLIQALIPESQGDSGAYFYRSTGLGAAPNTLEPVDAMFVDPESDDFYEFIGDSANELGLVSRLQDGNTTYITFNGDVVSNTEVTPPGENSRISFAPTGASGDGQFTYTMYIVGMPNEDRPLDIEYIGLVSNVQHDGWGYPGTMKFPIYTVQEVFLYSGGLGDYYELTFTDSSVASVTTGSVGTQINYYEYWFVALGYCIPMFKRTYFDSTLEYRFDYDSDNQYLTNQFWSEPELLKEDYVPFIVNLRDLPAVYYKMFNSLLNFENIDTKFKPKD